MSERRELEDIAEGLIQIVQDLVAEIRADRPNIRKVLDIVTVTQADLDQLATNLAGYNTDMKAGLSSIEQEVASLQAANPNLDLSGLTAAVSGTKDVHDQLQTDVPAATPDSPAASGPAAPDAPATVISDPLAGSPVSGTPADVAADGGVTASS